MKKYLYTSIIILVFLAGMSEGRDVSLDGKLPAVADSGRWIFTYEDGTVIDSTGAARVNYQNYDTTVTVNDDTTVIALHKYWYKGVPDSVWNTTTFKILPSVVNQTILLDSLNSLSGVIDILRDSLQYLTTATDVNVQSVNAGAIQAGDFATGAITAGAIATDAIGSAEIATNAIGESEIAAGAITSAEAPNLDAQVSTRSTYNPSTDSTLVDMSSFNTALDNDSTLLDFLRAAASGGGGSTPAEFVDALFNKVVADTVTGTYMADLIRYASVSSDTTLWANILDVWRNFDPAEVDSSLWVDSLSKMIAAQVWANVSRTLTGLGFTYAAGDFGAGSLNGKGDWLVSSSYPTNFSLLSIDGSGYVTATNGGSGPWTQAQVDSLFTLQFRGGANYTSFHATSLSSLGFTLSASDFGAGSLNGKGDWLVSSSYPTNFSSFAIDGGGQVTVGTNNDKSNYSLTANYLTKADSGATGASYLRTRYLEDKTGISLASSQNYTNSGSVASVTNPVSILTNDMEVLSGIAADSSFAGMTEGSNEDLFKADISGLALNVDMLKSLDSLGKALGALDTLFLFHGMYQGSKSKNSYTGDLDLWFILSPAGDTLWKFPYYHTGGQGGQAPDSTGTEIGL